MIVHPTDYGIGAIFAVAVQFSCKAKLKRNDWNDLIADWYVREVDPRTAPGRLNKRGHCKTFHSACFNFHAPHIKSGIVLPCALHPRGRGKAPERTKRASEAIDVSAFTGQKIHVSGLNRNPMHKARRRSNETIVE